MGGLKKKNYPSLFYEDGKGPLQSRTMGHNCLLGHLILVREGIGEDVWEALKNSSVGVILKLVDSNYVWSAKTVEYFLARQLAIKKEHEIWSLIRGHPIRFSLHEFQHITGLSCQPIPEDDWDIDHREFWDLIGVDVSAGPRYDQLKSVLGRCRGWDFEDRRRLGMLFVVVVGIFGAPHNSPIPLDVAKIVLDFDRFQSYPWGRVGFQELVNSIKVQALDRKSYTLHGCVHVLLIWTFESLTVFGEEFGNKKSEDEVPLLCWGGSRPRSNFETLLDKEEEVHGKVRVKHLVPKNADEIYPVWSDDVDDEQLDNLIQDIINHRPIDHSWGLLVKKKKRKLQMVGEEDLPVTEKDIGKEETKKRKAGAGNVLKEEKEGGGSRREDSGDNQGAFSGVIKVVEQLAGRFTLLESNIGQKIDERVDIIEAKFDEKIGDQVAALETRLGTKIANLESELRQLKHRVKDAEPTDAIYSTPNVDEESQSKAVGWEVKEKITSKDELPVKFVVKTSQTKTKLKGANTMDKVDKKSQKEFKVPRKLKIKGVVVKNEDKVEQTEDKGGQNKIKNRFMKKDGHVVPVKSVKIEDTVREEVRTKDEANKVVGDDSECYDVTQQVHDKANRMCSSSDETFSNPVAREANKALGKSLDLMMAKIHQGDDNDEDAPTDKPVPLLVHCLRTQERLITESPSVALYDPFKAVLRSKFQNLTDYLRNLERKPNLDSETELKFYKVLITPRKKWPTPDYGWLSDQHLAAGMTMLRRRSMRDPTPFHSERTAFLDPYFVMAMVNDYPQFNMDERNFGFRSVYVEAFNVRSPVDSPTNKKWFVDVDHLYCATHVKQDHWITLHIGLLKKKIFVYDSIVIHSKDKDILDACRPFARMIPYLMNSQLSEDVWKHTKKQFGVHRYKCMPKSTSKPVPQNLNPGDCGVYSFKYIECLALGVSFQGLDDDMIQAMREKMGAELFEEVSERESQFMS